MNFRDEESNSREYTWEYWSNYRELMSFLDPILKLSSVDSVIIAHTTRGLYKLFPEENRYEVLVII